LGILKKSNFGKKHLLCVRQDNINILDEAIISREIEKREKKTKILTQSKKDVAVRNVRNKIAIRFNQITNKNKLIIVVN